MTKRETSVRRSFIVAECIYPLPPSSRDAVNNAGTRRLVDEHSRVSVCTKITTCSPWPRREVRGALHYFPYIPGVATFRGRSRLMNISIHRQRKPARDVNYRCTRVELIPCRFYDVAVVIGEHLPCVRSHGRARAVKTRLITTHP